MKLPKQIEQFCQYCGSKQKFRYRGEFEKNNEDVQRYWYICSKCKHVTLFSLDQINRSEDNAKLQPKVYSADKVYEIGERIYHEEWQDYGKVIKKEISSSGHNIIVVQFDKLGQKKLIENYKQ